MWIHMDQHQQVIGCRKHFLVLASTTRMIHPPEYSTCGKSTKLGITIHIDNTQQHTLQKEHNVFLLDRIVKEEPSPIKLQKINDLHLYLKISRLSDIATEDDSHIHYWAFYGLPSSSTLQQPKRRVPIESSWKLWRDAIRKTFYDVKGMYPNYLGTPIPVIKVTPMLREMCSFNAVLDLYEDCFKAIIGSIIFGEEQVRDIIHLIKDGNLYTGSDGLEKDGRGSHTYGFISNTFDSTIWGGCRTHPRHQTINDFPTCGTRGISRYVTAFICSPSIHRTISGPCKL